MAYTINSQEYKELKLSIVSNNSVDFVHMDFVSYCITGENTHNLVQTFHQKNWNYDSEYNKTIIDKFEKKIRENNCIDEPIKLVEYTYYIASEHYKLLDLIDGYKRIEAMRRVLKDNPDINVSVVINLYKSDKPDSMKTYELFERFGHTPIHKFVGHVNEIIKRLREIYKKPDFKFLNGVNTKLPNLGMRIFRNNLVLQFKKYSETKDVTKYNVDAAIKRFVDINEQISIKGLDWFNSNDNEMKRKEVKITQEQYRNAQEVKCFLGLLGVERLINKCII